MRHILPYYKTNFSHSLFSHVKNFEFKLIRNIIFFRKMPANKGEDYPSLIVGSKNDMVVTFGQDLLTIEDVGRIAEKSAVCKLSEEPDFVKRIHDGPKTVEKLVQEGHVIYGVTTGLGESCTVTISKELIAKMPSNVIRFLGCG
jgi:hypothetical protein